MNRVPEKDRLKEAAETINPLFAQLRTAFKKIRQAFDRDVGVSPPTYFILQMLSVEDGISQGDISRLFGEDPARVTRLAKLMEGEGLIERARDPDDNRVVRMHLTPEGRRAFELAYGRSEAFRSRISSTLNEEEQQELQRLLGKVIKAMEESVAVGQE
jgi:DNA-binding MarR family transcriptional regulator